MFSLTFEIGNDAFALDAPAECARILRALADRLDVACETGIAGPVYDINGNVVGAWRLPEIERDEDHVSDCY